MPLVPLGAHQYLMPADRRSRRRRGCEVRRQGRGERRRGREVRRRGRGAGVEAVVAPVRVCAEDGLDGIKTVKSAKKASSDKRAMSTL